MPDTRIFRITRQFEPRRASIPRYRKSPMPEATIEYGNKRVASAKCGAGGYSYRLGPVVKVEATDFNATEGWTDVSEEFGIFN